MNTFSQGYQQTASSVIWTRISKPIYYDDNRLTTSASVNLLDMLIKVGINFLKHDITLDIASILFLF